MNAVRNMTAIRSGQALSSVPQLAKQISAPGWHTTPP
jgi:hypothetical protein